MPLDEYREGSIGVPLPGMLAMICKPGTAEELPAGSEGEICLAGPAVMIGYLDNPKATVETLRRHDDGRIWLHTGDIGRMDADGFFYFTDRLKRLIKSSGLDVFPAKVEAVLYRHPLVLHACVVGVPDATPAERVKAFVVLKDQDQATPDTRRELIAYCRAQLERSCPHDIEFRRELPKTRFGKVAYRTLMEDERARQGPGAAADRVGGHAAAELQRRHGHAGPRLATQWDEARPMRET
jgi:long-chain acyl-CoA synthetase